MVSSTPNVNYVASGVLVPVPLAGEQVLELCNTFAGWGGGKTREYLLSYEHLVVWARERGFVDSAEAAWLVERARADVPEAERVLERVLRLRAAFYAVETVAADDDDRGTIAREAERASASARLEWGTQEAAWVLPRTLELPLLAVAISIGSVVTAPIRVGRCPGSGCGWLFADPSGRRRWCSMAVCGNRAKVRRHAERTAARRPR